MHALQINVKTSGAKIPQFENTISNVDTQLIFEFSTADNGYAFDLGSGIPHAGFIPCGQDDVNLKPHKEGTPPVEVGDITC